MPTSYPTIEELIQPPIAYGDVVPVAFFDVLQEAVGGLGAIDLTLTNATTVKASAGTNEARSVLGVGGALRWIETSAVVAMPGGSGAGRYSIYATTGATLISGVEDETDYTWALAIVKEGAAAPATPKHKIIGYLDWSGSAITRLVQTFGRRDDAPRPAVAPTGGVPALEAIMPAGATANPLQVLVGGSNVFSVSAAGAVTAASMSGAQATLSKNDRTALQLSGAAAGLTIGGDTQLYRVTGSVLGTPGSLAAGGYLQANQQAYVGGPLHFGAEGGLFFDTILERSGAGALLTPGVLTVAGNLLLTTSGTIVFGTAGDTNLYRAAANRLRTDDELVAGGPLVATAGFTHTGTLGLFGAAAVAQHTGWGSPSPPGGAKRSVLTYGSTLGDVIDELETLKSDLRSYGVLGA